MGHLVVAGSYEGGLHGWRLDGASEAATLAFSFGAHDGCTRCVATTGFGGTVLSGGDDEKIRVYSLKSRKQVGELSQHTGTVTALTFCGAKHAVSASGDGTLLVWRMRGWDCVHVLGGHKGPVLSLAPHPSGRMVLSTGVDRTLRLWDLTEGRVAFITRTKGEALKAFWSSDGSCYGVVLKGKVEVRDVEDNAVLTEIDVGSAVLDAHFLDDAPFVATCDGTGAVSVFSVDDGDLVWRRKRKAPTTPGRVKALACLRLGAAAGGDDDDRYASADADALREWASSRALLAATSSGTVETWRPGDGDADDDADAPASVASGVSARLTCLAASAAADDGPPESTTPAPPEAPRPKATNKATTKATTKATNGGAKARSPAPAKRAAPPAAATTKRDLKAKLKRVKRARANSLSSN